MMSRQSERLRRVVTVIGLFHLASVVACGGGDDDARGTGAGGKTSSTAAGRAGVGGHTSSAGGFAMNGGTTNGGASIATEAGSGGTSAEGGMSTTTDPMVSRGGSNPTGTSNGGDGLGLGGASGAGGITSNGGIPQGGGVASTGGTSSAGGALGTGGSTGGSWNAAGSGSIAGTASMGGIPSAAGTSSSGGIQSAAGASSTAGNSNAGGASEVCSTPLPNLSNFSYTTLTTAAMSTISYGGYLNGESFQQDGLVSFNGYQYASYWNASGNVVLSRRQLSTDPTLEDGAWVELKPIPAYVNTSKDAHNTISLGVSPADGTLHLAIDHHVSTLHYLKSVPDLLTNPSGVAWADTSFTAMTSQLVTGATVDQVTYPRFITEPGGRKMLFSARIGTSGSGDEYLWEYDTETRQWTSLGMYLWGTFDPDPNDGVDSTVNAYVHSIAYTKGGSRLHVSWCWRETPDPITNHDLFYAYSDDNGRTWLNNAGEVIAQTGSSFISTATTSAKVWSIEQDRGLINQEHMAIDSLGRVHVLLSHVPDGVTTTVGDFVAQRTQAQYFHYLRDVDGTWSRHAIGDTSVILNFRGKLAIAPSNNVYAVLPVHSPKLATNPALGILAATPCDNYAGWTALVTNSDTAFFSDPLVDASRLESGYELTVYYPQKNYNTNIRMLEYTLK